MSGPVPLTIISGFLGSGKTSLLNHLLSQSDGRRITAMVNDFGALNIDAELIEAKHGNQISLTNGCACCSIGDDLTRSFIDVMQQTPLPDHIVIEASGVAEPNRIAGFAAVDPHLRLDGIVTLVDAGAHHLHKDDPHLADNYAKQIDAAHMLVISKPDLVKAAALAALRDALATDRPDIPILQAEHGALPIDLLLGLNGDSPAAPDSNHLVSHGFESRALHLHAPTDRDRLADYLLGLRPQLLRAKGVLTDNRGAYVIDYAGGRIACRPFDKQPSGHFVLIGKPGLPDETTLVARLKQAA